MREQRPMTERETTNQTPFVKDFDISFEGLSSNERSLSDLLYLAAINIAPIYALQQNNQYPGANFYPPGIPKERIEEAAKEDPSILSEYTIVKEGQVGNLFATPYHVEYRDKLKPAANFLKQAAQVSSDPNFAHYLLLKAESLLDGDYEKSERVWLSIPEPLIDIVIGPYDRYDDQLFSKKYSYQAWTGILEKEETEKAQSFVDSFLEVYGWQGKPIRTRVDRTMVFAGLASIGWSANNLPCQMEWREKYGSKVTIFLPSFHQRFEERLLDLHKIRPQSKEEDPNYLERISRIFLFAHESCHPLVRRPGDEQRLKGQYSAVSELYCDILGIFTSLKLIDKEITMKDWELLIPTYLAWGLNRFRTAQDIAAVSPYLIGEATALNYLLSTEAVQIENSEIRLGSSEVLERNLGELINQLEYLMSKADEENAADFFRRFGDIQKFASLT